MNDEELLEWGKKYYPELGNNVRLLKILYEKLKNRGVKAQFSNKKKIEELEDGNRVTIDAVVIDVNVKKYMGCSKCKKKSCECGAEKKEFWIYRLKCADDTGEVSCVLFTDVEQNISVGDKIEIFGFYKDNELKINQFNKKFDAREIEKNEKDEQLKNMLLAMKGTGLIAISEFEKWLKRRGYTIDDVRRFEGELIKFVDDNRVML
ncbi:MAG: hypothetical protein QW228_07480 [Candidatus Aenigmatarchaeota archaeon]